jgi:hypothetical protein
LWHRKEDDSVDRGVGLAGSDLTSDRVHLLRGGRRLVGYMYQTCR